jgi:hypothetical protein
VAEIGRPIRRLLTRSSRPEAAEVAQALRTETVGGVLLLVGVCSRHGGHGKYPPTRRIRTNNDLPARGALRPPQPAAAFLGGRRRPVLPTLAAVDDLIANVIIAVHPIAHDLGRQATLDWKITDSSYRVVVMNADAAPPSRSTAGSR